MLSSLCQHCRCSAMVVQNARVSSHGAVVISDVVRAEASLSRIVDKPYCYGLTGQGDYIGRYLDYSDYFKGNASHVLSFCVTQLVSISFSSSTSRWLSQSFLSRGWVCKPADFHPQRPRDPDPTHRR